MAQARVLVIGAGVIGLTTALSLRQEGFEVVVIADNFAPTTSVAAGALWEWPPSVCGSHYDEALLNRSQAWCAPSYRKFSELAQGTNTGVFLRPATFYFRIPVRDNPNELGKTLKLRTHVAGFLHAPELAERNGVSPHAGVVDAYTYVAPMIDTDAYLDWLRLQVTQTGCELLERHISGSLAEQQRTLLTSFRAEAIANCTGLGSQELATDRHLAPHRGALIFVRNDGTHMPRVNGAHCIAHDTAQDRQDMVFIVPRGENQLVLGGLIEPDEWTLEVDLQNHPPIREMLQRCVDFLPILANAQLDEREPVRVGLRPFRGSGVRLEREPGTRIIHNYGHGGSGFTLSWGCAFEAVGLVTQMLDLQPRVIARPS
ncbi:MAG: amino acid oxidase [Candidatus Meridianibacter frigidus]|nr:MAG: amino acid oxidase [Candidatus Eremiobacteraeota bacterium]